MGKCKKDTPSIVVIIDGAGSLSGVRFESGPVTVDLSGLILENGTDLKTYTAWSELTANLLVDRVEVDNARPD